MLEFKALPASRPLSSPSLPILISLNTNVATNVIRGATRSVSSLFVSRSTAKEFPHGLAGLFEEAFAFLLLEAAFRSQGGYCSSSTPRMLSVSGNLS